VPTFLVYEFVDILLTSMVNTCLQQGRLPISQKHAIVTPLLKKPVLDTYDLANSNLTFMSKLMEHAVAKQLNSSLTDYTLLPRNQSAYRRQHSTETALLRFWSDFLTAADSRRVSLLSLIDLSSAFDCVDRNILLE